MVAGLKQKSKIAYILIGLVSIIILALSVFSINAEKFAVQNVNLAAQQPMIIQRIALLCNNYYDNPSNKNIAVQIQNLQHRLKDNHQLIKNIDNKKVFELLYSPYYDYDDLLTNYTNHVTSFLSSKEIKHLKIINYTNESLLSISNTLVDLLTVKFEKYITLLIVMIVFASLFLIALLYFVYTLIILKSISEIENALIKIKQNESFIESILENSALSIITTTVTGVITSFNKEAEDSLGYKREELINKETPAVFHKLEEVGQRAAQLSEEFGTTIEPGFDVFVEKTKRGLKNSDEWIYVAKNGQEHTVKLSISALKDTEGKINGYLGIAEDITELKENEREIKNYLHLIDENIITSTTDIHGKIISSSEAFCQISGYSKGELFHQNHRILKHEDMDPKIYEDLWKTIRSNKIWQGEIKNKKKDGSSYWVRATISPVYDTNGKKTGYTAIRQDITDKKIVELISITDGLTDLYNRRHFNNTAQIEIDRAKRTKKIFAFTILDIDNFKKYNDMYGHQEGDNVLINVAKSLKQTFQRSHDIVFRLGGEEFGAIFTADSIHDASIIVERARANLEALNIEHKENLPSKVVTASFGVVVLYANDFTKTFKIDSIYKETDNLLYEAKESGRNKLVIKEIS